MRGSDERSGDLLSYVDLEDRVPAQHPLRLIRRVVNEVLVALERLECWSISQGPIISIHCQRNKRIGDNVRVRM